MALLGMSRWHVRTRAGRTRPWYRLQTSSPASVSKSSVALSIAQPTSRLVDLGSGSGSGSGSPSGVVVVAPGSASVGPCGSVTVLNPPRRSASRAMLGTASPISAASAGARAPGCAPDRGRSLPRPARSAGLAWSPLPVRSPCPARRWMRTIAVPVATWVISSPAVRCCGFGVGQRGERFVEAPGVLQHPRGQQRDSAVGVLAPCAVGQSIAVRAASKRLDVPTERRQRLHLQHRGERGDRVVASRHRAPTGPPLPRRRRAGGGR